MIKNPVIKWPGWINEIRGKARRGASIDYLEANLPDWAEFLSGEWQTIQTTKLRAIEKQLRAL